MSGFLGDLLATLFERQSWSPGRAGKGSMPELCTALMSVRGEVSGQRLAQSAIARYEQLDEDDRRAFFVMLAEEMDLDPEAVTRAAQAYGKSAAAPELEALMRSAEPPRQELLRRLNQAPGATDALVRMRHDLLKMIDSHPQLKRVDLDFRHLFASWFNRGFLVLRRIDWDSPARILEKIIQYEAVHAINDWTDLRRRLKPQDRRCFAFFHPSMPAEPLIFVEVALVKGTPGSVQALLARDGGELPPEQADTAVFYSISNCQAGLRGISFGNSLIKQVVDVLGRELPHLRSFVTLSPIPGLTRWLEARASEGSAQAEQLLDAREDAAALEEQAETLRRYAAYYLLEAKRTDGKPMCPVARFHLGNGAEIAEVHAGADVSANGLAASCGAMVNYRYDLKTVERNLESHAERGTVASTRAVRALAAAAAAGSGSKAAGKPGSGPEAGSERKKDA